MPTYYELTPEDEAKILSAAAPAIIGLYRRKRESAVQNLLGKFRSGETNVITALAELSIIDSLLRDTEARLDTLSATHTNRGERK